MKNEKKLIKENEVAGINTHDLIHALIQAGVKFDLGIEELNKVNVGEALKMLSKEDFVKLKTSIKMLKEALHSAYNLVCVEHKKINNN